MLYQGPFCLFWCQRTSEILMLGESEMGHRIIAVKLIAIRSNDLSGSMTFITSNNSFVNWPFPCNDIFRSQSKVYFNSNKFLLDLLDFETFFVLIWSVLV
jgi:hypothetical protein